MSRVQQLYPLTQFPNQEIHLDSSSTPKNDFSCQSRGRALQQPHLKLEHIQPCLPYSATSLEVKRRQPSKVADPTLITILGRIACNNIKPQSSLSAPVSPKTDPEFQKGDFLPFFF
ncbi:hypothetical protein CDAR_28451 [Caerostris darwini]|uniref:Uncharacterized protein n=1 Tax=Caerostris darwini TaxID=1538125 RepID=A0AAV4Q192_9ARAC|nr:hypothetical protein CDAR_28451 [Caerostris darwini]